MKATLSQFRQSPRKVRLVADLVRGKTVQQAREALTFLPKKSAPIVAKLIESAVANAKQSGADVDSLVVKGIAVNKGMVLRRYKPMARGRAAQVHRVGSIITLELGTTQTKNKKQKTTKKNPAPSIV